LPSAATPPWSAGKGADHRRAEATIDRAIWHRDQTDEAQLKKLLEDHNRWTGSKRARELLDNWAEAAASS
jgi:glutamate synthase domain-containing protein 3